MGAAGAGGTYEIEKSLRFNGKGQGNTGLTRTPSSQGDRRVFTISWWLKLCNTAVETGVQYLWSCDRSSNNPRAHISFRENQLSFECTSTDNNPEFSVRTTRKFRDTSSWYHIVIAVNTSAGTNTDRIKFYVNGVQETSVTGDNHSLTWPSSGFQTPFGSNEAEQCMFRPYTGVSTSNAYDGYAAEIHYIDGSQLTPSSFGETNADTGQWVPKKYGGGYGNSDNGCYLNFSDNSNTTAATLGKDSSGNGNNWTPNNFSVATDDEIACDSFSDTPTNNWCTMNAINNPNGATLKNGGLEVNLVYPHDDNGVYATFGVTSGKWYWEAKCTSAGNRGQVGVTDAGHKSGSNSGYNYSVATRHTGGTGDTSGTSNSNLDAVIDSGNWVTFCFDADNGQIWYSREAAPNISGTANVTGLTLGSGRVWKPHIRETGNPVSNFTFNFGASAAGFKYGPPNADYKALNAANLPEPTIKKGSDYFNTALYTGTGSSRTVTGVGFAPDLTWIKKRNSAENHEIQDTVRGATKRLACNTQDAEATVAGSISAFTSDGFTVVDAGTTNENTHTYVAWNWKGGSSVSNGSGDVTSTVRANASAGFCIVGDTGTGSDHTIGHGLGVKPDMIIRKARGRTDNWCIYHKDLDGDDATEYLQLNETDGQANYHEIWNDTAPTSSVFTVGSDTAVNENTTGYITYLFSGVEGYSKAGRYTGNGSADGTFVSTGFKPAFVLIKSNSHSEAWNIFDNKRDPDNKVHHLLAPNTNTEENNSTAARELDFLSNGFKMRGTNDTINGSSKTYIYLAFAERPFKYANAR